MSGVSMNNAGVTQGSYPPAVALEWKWVNDPEADEDLVAATAVAAADTFAHRASVENESNLLTKDICSKEDFPLIVEGLSILHKVDFLRHRAILDLPILDALFAGGATTQGLIEGLRRLSRTDALTAETLTELVTSLDQPGN